MPTYPDPSDLVSALTRADGTTDAHSVDHGRVIGIWENAKKWGATGDGVTDDTLALQAAIDELGFTGGTAFLPVGVYNHTGLTMDSGVRLVGSGTSMDESVLHGTRLHYTPSTGTALTVTPYAAGLSGPYISDFGMSGTSKLNNTTGIFIDGSGTPAARGMVHNVRVGYFGTGIKTDQALGITFLQCYCFENGTGLHLFHDSNLCTVIAGGYRQNDTGIHVDSSSTINLLSTWVESNYVTGVLVDGGIMSALVVVGGHFENNPRAIYINCTAPDHLYDSSIFHASIAAASTAGIEVNGASNISITDVALPSNDTIILGATTQNCGVKTMRNPSVTTSGNSNNIQYGLGTNGFYQFLSGATGGIHFDGVIQVSETSDVWGAPAAGEAHIFMRNVAGKEQLCVRFPTGVAQVMASEP